MSSRGFTLIELVVTMIIVGILAVVVLPRFSLLSGFDEVGYRDKVKATLEYARKAAVAQRRSVRVTLAADRSLTLDVENATPEGEGVGAGTYPRALTLPTPDTKYCGSNPPSNKICAPFAVTAMTGPATLVFTPLGRAAAAVYSITGSSTLTLTVDAETGYVY